MCKQQALTTSCCSPPSTHTHHTKQLHSLLKLTDSASRTPHPNKPQALRYEPGMSHVVSSGALATTSGKKTGRSPKDKRVVREEESEGEVCSCACVFSEEGQLEGSCKEGELS